MANQAELSEWLRQVTIPALSYEGPSRAQVLSFSYFPWPGRAIISVHESHLSAASKNINGKPFLCSGVEFCLEMTCQAQNERFPQNMPNCIHFYLNYSYCIFGMCQALTPAFLDSDLCWYGSVDIIWLIWLKLHPSSIKFIGGSPNSQNFWMWLHWRWEWRDD